MKDRDTTVRLLLADDHSLVRQGLRALLEQKGFEIVGEAANGREAVRLARELKPEVVVLELSMPLLNGLEAARQISQLSGGIKSILLALPSERHMVVEALRAGVEGFLLKTQPAEDLIKAVREVTRGGICLSPKAARTMVDAYLGKVKLPADPLTSREREVLQLVAEGKTAKEVGSLLGVSPKTVESHRGKIMKKLNIHDTAGLVRYAIRRRLIQA